jgi:hypothetical protein
MHKWIAEAIGKPGALHKDLGVPVGKTIPLKKIHKAEHAGGIEAKRANLAETLRHLHKSHEGHK